MNAPTKLRDLATPAMRERLKQAWPFPVPDAGPLVLDGEKPIDPRAPVFSRGDRVITRGTPGARTAIERAGGPGTVVSIGAPRPNGDVFVYVHLDGSDQPAQGYHLFELKPEVTV